MGVIYKLQAEVVDFIINQKKQTPALGCRDLAKIVSQEFHFPVSKSSVSSVLRGSQLSSRVGRRSLSGKPREIKKFEIPLERKSHLFPGRYEAQSPLTSPKTISKQPTDSSTEKKPAAAKPDAGAVRASVGAMEKKNIYQNAGTVILRAAQWEMAAQPIWGNFLHGLAPTVFPEDLGKVADALIAARAANIPEEDVFLLKQRHFLWEACGLDAVRMPQEIAAMLRKASGWEDLVLKMSMDLPATVTRIKTIKIIFEDGASFCCCPRMTSWDKTNVQTGQSLFLEKCMDAISNLIINNVQSVNFLTVPLEDRSNADFWSLEFFSLFSSFENQPGKRMVKIILLDQQGQEIVNLDTIPEQKRCFLAGIWPEQAKFLNLLSLFKKNKAKFEKISLEGGKNYFFVQEAAVNLVNRQQPSLKGQLRLFFVLNKEGSSPICAIVSNSLSSAKDLISAYIQRWPNGFIKPENFSAKERELGGGIGSKEDLDVNTYISNIYGIDSLVDSFARLIQKQVFAEFFGPAEAEKNGEILQALCVLPGEIYRSKDLLSVKLILPTGKPFPFQPDLDKAIQILNQSAVHDSLGRQLILGIS